LGDAPGMARVKANLFVNSWQGAILVARAGEGWSISAESSAISKRLPLCVPGHDLPFIEAVVNKSDRIEELLAAIESFSTTLVAEH
jgi:hypothetical protein